MSKKLIATSALALTLTATAIAASATPAAAVPAASLGACNMLHTSPTGFEGMLKASDRGLGNMIPLVVGSLEAGCQV